MAVLDIGSGLSGAVTEFVQWRAKKADAKVRLAEIKAQAQTNGWSDEFATVAFIGSYLVILFMPPILDLFGVNGGTMATDIAAHANSLLQGTYGYIVGAVALAAVGIDKAGKAFRKALK